MFLGAVERDKWHEMGLDDQLNQISKEIVVLSIKKL